MRKWGKSLKIAAVGLTLASGIITTGQNQAVHAEAAAKQGKFNMSYLFSGNSQSYVSQVDKSGQALDVISPNYIDLKSDGTLQVSETFDASFIDAMHKEGKRVVPFISNDYSEQTGETAIDKREALAAQLAEMVKANNLDGVNMDIENVNKSYRDKYTDMIRLIRAKLPADKEVSVAVPANPEADKASWLGAYDYKALAQNSDYLMVMAYDESYPGDPDPGPVASLSFVEKSIQYALTQVSSDKIVLGIPFYGRYWNQNPASNGDSMSNETIEQLIKMYKGNKRFDLASQSPTATFVIQPTDVLPTVNGESLPPGSYTVWYEDEQSIKKKLELVKRYNLKGTGSWSLNQAANGTWNYYSLWADGFYFDDMQTHWAQAAVLDVANRGWMVGTSTGAFTPDAPLTRAEAAVILVRALGLTGDAGTAAASFNDVPAAHWARQEIALAKQHGLIQGISSDLFAPDQPITREQMAALLSRVVNVPSTGGAAKASFSDVPEGSWSYAAIAAMSRMGVVDGFANGTFRPQAFLTRAEMAALLSRIAPQLKK